ncbi:ATP-binding protein [Frigidibacter sp. MR17.24]|uniref:ATP-binding protein n=1 Tax=Frigidibacter sp. MR17.24 TaxID=3127345 RepID=UPI003012C115
MPDPVDSLLAGVPLPLLLVGADQRLIAANTPAQALFGAIETGRPLVTVIRNPGLLDALDTVFSAGTAVETRILRTGALHDLTYRLRVSPIGGLGRPAALIAFTDTTDLEKIEEMRRDFVANVSHELRTPLTALLGFIETLTGPARNDAAARDRFLGIMAREAQRMNRLVRDLLSLSRVEQEERMRPGERIDIVAVLRGAVAALRPVAEAASVEIEILGGEGPVALPADADQMAQVFSNLVENAVKYGGAGKTVTIEITRDARDPGLRGPAVCFAVIDRGEGIDEIHLPRLTERFYRVDAHRSREKGGTGLGLAIVKHILNRHRGRLKIESTRGEGSRFTVILPDQ